MRISDNILQSVVFICRPKKESQEESKYPFVGTGFLAVDAENCKVGKDHLFLITAKHVAKKISNGDFFIRVNNKEGSFENKQENTRWFYHPTDNSVDVAVASCSLTPDKAEYGALPLDMFLSDEILKQGKIGIGDEVYIIGLFAHVTGTKRNQPIARVGNIAMIPSERIQVETDNFEGKIEAYLIEARSSGGLSGSPVFVRESFLPNKGCKGEHYLLGLAIGHWAPKLKNDILEIKIRHENGVNVGIAAVVPAKKY